MAREYISVDSDSKESKQKVKLTNVQNEFTGEFLIPESETSKKNIKQMFIQGAKTASGETVPIDNSSGKLILQIPNSGESNKIETIQVNGTALTPSSKAVNIVIKVNGTQVATENDKSINIVTGSSVYQVEFTTDSNVTPNQIKDKLQQEGKTIKAGDIIVVKRNFTETRNDTSKDYTAISTYTVFDNAGSLAFIPLAPSKLKGGVDGAIPAVIEDGESVFRIDEIEFDELHTQELYISNRNIFEFIPNVSVLGDQIEDKLTALDITNGTTINEVAAKLNEVIRRLKIVAGSQIL